MPQSTSEGCDQRQLGVKEGFAALEDVPTDMGGHAWLEHELVERSDWIVPLSTSGITELEAASRSLAVNGDAEKLARLTRAEFPLPRLGPILEALRPYLRSRRETLAR